MSEYSQVEIESLIKTRLPDFERGSIRRGREDDEYVFSAGCVRFRWHGAEFSVNSNLRVERKRGKFMESGTPLTRTIELALTKETR